MYFPIGFFKNKECVIHAAGVETQFAAIDHAVTMWEKFGYPYSRTIEAASYVKAHDHIRANPSNKPVPTLALLERMKKAVERE